MAASLRAGDFYSKAATKNRVAATPNDVVTLGISATNSGRVVLKLRDGFALTWRLIACGSDAGYRWSITTTLPTRQ